MWSLVKGVKIKLSKRTIWKTSHLSEGDVDEWILDYDPYEAYSLMTNLPTTTEAKQIMLTSFNTNSFPPLQHFIHHMFTTIVTPQGGGRCRLTKTQQFLFYCLFKNIQVNLSSVMMVVNIWWIRHCSGRNELVLKLVSIICLSSVVAGKSVTRE